MTTAKALSYGDLFVGYVESKDYYAADYKRWGDHGEQRAVPFDQVTVVVKVFGDGTSAREIMELFCGLPSDHPHQLYDSSTLWIAGQRRRDAVRVLGCRCPRREAVAA